MLFQPFSAPAPRLHRRFLRRALRSLAARFKLSAGAAHRQRRIL